MPPAMIAGASTFALAGASNLRNGLARARVWEIASGLNIGPTGNMMILRQSILKISGMMIRSRRAG